MLVAAPLSLFFSIPVPTSVDAKLTGMWVLNPDKSHWGGLPAPRHLVLKIEQLDSSLAVWEITKTPAGRDLFCRKMPLYGKRCTSDSRLDALTWKACIVFASAI
jgi:hypothetical protein